MVYGCLWHWVYRIPYLFIKDHDCTVEAVESCWSIRKSQSHRHLTELLIAQVLPVSSYQLGRARAKNPAPSWTEMDLGMSESGGTQLWNLMHTTVIISCNFPKVSKLLAGILVGIDHFETSICTFSPRIQCEQRRKKAPCCNLWKFRNAEDRSLQIFIESCTLGTATHFWWLNSLGRIMLLLPNRGGEGSMSKDEWLNFRWTSFSPMIFCEFCGRQSGGKLFLRDTDSCSSDKHTLIIADPGWPGCSM